MEYNNTLENTADIEETTT